MVLDTVRSTGCDPAPHNQPAEQCAAQRPGPVAVLQSSATLSPKPKMRERERADGDPAERNGCSSCPFAYLVCG